MFFFLVQANTVIYIHFPLWVHDCNLKTYAGPYNIQQILIVYHSSDTALLSADCQR